jgi:hypothetical protein
MFAPTKVFNFGGRENDYNEKQHDEPPFRDKQAIALALKALADTALKLAEYDKATGNEDERSMLVDLRDALMAAHREAKGTAARRPGAAVSIDIRELPLSEKQIEYVCEANLYVNLAEGAIRSGKTASGLLRWLMYISDPKTPRTGDLVVSAKTYDTAVRNIFNPLRDARLFGPLAKATSYTRGAPTAMVLGQTVEVITFNDERSEQRLRGMTARGGYVDEWSLMPKSFHDQLIGRASVDGAQLFGNTNPDNPGHWLKVEGIDEAKPGGRNAADWYVLKFLLDDNPALSERVKARYRRQYTGMWHRRMINGEWRRRRTACRCWVPRRGRRPLRLGRNQARRQDAAPHRPLGQPRHRPRCRLAVRRTAPGRRRRRQPLPHPRVALGQQEAHAAAVRRRVLQAAAEVAGRAERPPRVGVHRPERHLLQQGDVRHRLHPGRRRQLRRRRRPAAQQPPR